VGEDFTEGAGSGPGESATPLAGIIAGRGHGREFTGGIVGVAPGADLLSIRVAGGDGTSGGSGGGEASAEALADGIRHAVGERVQVLALTQAAAGAESDEAVQDAIRHANRKGVFVVAPAGEGDTAYPGAYKGATAVGAVGEDLAVTSESPSSGVALTAPGAEIRAPAAGGGYTTVDGTAAAAAFTAGAAALVRAESPQLRPSEVADVLKSSAASGAGGEGAAGYGAGVLDASAAMQEGAAATQGDPLVDEGLAQSADEEQAVPGWMLWSGGALLVALGAVACVLVWRRVTANPYDLPSREPERGRGRTPGRPKRAADREPAGAGAGTRTGAARRAASGRRRGGRRRR